MTDAPASHAPPYSEDAERALLGCLLMPGDSLRVAGECVEHGLDKGDLYSPAHQMVFRCVRYLYDKRIPPDVISVADTLRRYGQIDAVGGDAFLHKLLDAAPAVAHAEFYLDIVQDKALARRGIEACRETERALYDANESPRNVIADGLARMGELAGAVTVCEPSKQDVWAKCKAMAAAAKEGVPMGLPSPWPTFNSHIGGAEFGGVTLLVGGSKTRKSYMALQWGLHAATELNPPMPGAMFAFEDGIYRATDRAVCALGGVNCWQLEQGHCSPADMERLDEAAARLRESPMQIRARRGLSPARRRLEIARGVANEGWRWVVFDAFKDMESSGGDPKQEAQLMGWLTDVAGEFGIAMIVVHHVNKQAGAHRKNETPEERRLRERVQKFDIRGSTRITDDPRMILALQCQLLRGADGRAHYGRYVLDILARNYGPTGALAMWLDKDTGLFYENASLTPFANWTADGQGEEYWRKEDTKGAQGNG